jgi:hypothetical protein
VIGTLQGPGSSAPIITTPLSRRLPSMAQSCRRNYIKQAQCTWRVTCGGKRRLCLCQRGRILTTPAAADQGWGGRSGTTESGETASTCNGAVSLWMLQYPHQDSKRVLECLQKSHRIANSATEEIVAIQPYVDTLDQYLLYLDPGATAVRTCYWVPCRPC